MSETNALDIEAIQPLRSEKNDLIIVCPKKSLDEGCTYSRFGVELAVLACHSKVFMDMLQACNHQLEVQEIKWDEPHDVVYSFLKIIYGFLPDPREAWPFDRCVDLIEMGDKYEVNSVIDRGILQLCQSIEMIAYEEPRGSINSRYKEACIVKFLSIWHKGKADRLSIASFRVLRLTFSQIWSVWIIRCGLNPSHNSLFQNNGYHTSHCNSACQDAVTLDMKALITISDFIDEKTYGLFTSEELFTFHTILEDHILFNKDISDVLRARGFCVGSDAKVLDTNSFM